MVDCAERKWAGVEQRVHCPLHENIDAKNECEAENISSFTTPTTATQHTNVRRGEKKLFSIEIAAAQTMVKHQHPTVKWE